VVVRSAAEAGVRVGAGEKGGVIRWLVGAAELSEFVQQLPQGAGLIAELFGDVLLGSALDYDRPHGLVATVKRVDRVREELSA
jgi:hypothetical protein